MLRLIERGWKWMRRLMGFPTLVDRGEAIRDASEALDDETHEADQEGNQGPDEAAEPRAGATVPKRAPPESPSADPSEKRESSSPALSADHESTVEGAGAPEADGTREEDQTDSGKTTHTESREYGPSSATSGDGVSGSGAEVDTDGHDDKDDGEASAPSKGPKKVKKPRGFGGRRTGVTQNAPVERASFNAGPELICRKIPGTVRWETALSVDDSAASVKQNGEPLSLRNGSWPLARFAGHLSVDLKERSPVTVPLFDQNPLIFKLKKDWGGDGRKVPQVTKGHFIVIAPVGWGRLGHAPVDPEGCSDPAFMAHYFFRDGKESASDLDGFQEHDVPSGAPDFTLHGRTVFDDSDEGDLFVGKPPRLIPADRVLWARVGEESENGWKGCNFQPSECSLADAMDARQGRFFLRVYDQQVAMLDGAQFRYLRDLREIQVNGEPYSGDTLLVPSAAGYSRTSVRFMGVDGSPIHATPLPGTAAVVDETGCLIAEPRPEADAVSCTLLGDGGSVAVALRLPRIWWRMERDGDESDNEYRSTPFEMTRAVFREGKLVVLCEGRQREGSLICRSCGAHMTGPKATHKSPSDSPCSGTLGRFSLGHELVTDVVRLQFPGIHGEWAAYSVAYAMLLGAAEALDVPDTDLNATIAGGANPAESAIVLYDNVPGGAGLVAQLEQEAMFGEVLTKARARVQGNCGCDSSCYGCLRSYRNQFAHPHLNRRSALEAIV